MKSETKDVGVPSAELKEGDRVVCLDGKARRIAWIRKYSNVVMYRFDGLVSVLRDAPTDMVSVRTKV